MRKRLIKKIAKKYGDSWWTVLSDTKESCSYALMPPNRWKVKKILDDFHKQRLRGKLYQYAISMQEGGEEMYYLIGWALGLVLALTLVFIFEIKNPIATVLIGFFLSMCGLIIGSTKDMQ